MSYLLHVCKVCIAREEDVCVGYYGQFQKKIVLGVTAALWYVVYPKLCRVFFKELHKPVHIICIEVTGELGAGSYAENLIYEPIRYSQLVS